MKEFRDLASFVRFLEADVVPAIQPAEFSGVDRGAMMIEADAKLSIGFEQHEPSGPFAAWAALSSATMEGFTHPKAGWIEGKEALGYTGHRSATDPLLREGHLEASYTHISAGYAAVVGSDDDVAVWQEMGTPNARYPIPPRSVLGAAAFRMTPGILEQLGARVVWAIRGLRGSNI